METLRLENVMRAFRNKGAQSGGIIVDAEWYIIKISPGSLGDIIIYRPRAIDIVLGRKRLRAISMALGR